MFNIQDTLKTIYKHKEDFKITIVNTKGHYITITDPIIFQIDFRPSKIVTIYNKKYKVVTTGVTHKGKPFVEITLHRSWIERLILWWRGPVI